MNYYLVYGEDLNSGIIHSQVLEPIKYNCDLNVKLVIISKFYSSVFNSFVPPVPMVNLRLAIPQRFILFNFISFLVPFLAMIYAMTLFFFIPKGSVLGARSYFATLIAFYLSKMKDIDYVFDSRSLFVDENVNANKLLEGSKSYFMWLRIEKKLLLNAKKVICVSYDQENVYKSRCNGVVTEIIPCFAPCRGGSQNILVESRRRELGFSNKDIIVCYYGSLNSGWNNIDLYKKAFNNILSLGYKVLIISQDYKNLIKEDDLLDDGVVILDTTGKLEVELLESVTICDYGIVLMKKSHDWKSRLSIKFVTYLSCGLNVIVGEFVGEAVRIGQKYFSSRIVIYDEDLNLQKINKLKEGDEELVRKLFGYGNLKKYFD